MGLSIWLYVHRSHTPIIALFLRLSLILGELRGMLSDHLVQELSKHRVRNEIFRANTIARPLDSYLRDLKQEYCNISSGGEQIDDVLNRLVRFMVGGFQFAVGAVSGMGLMMEAAVGEGATEAFVEKPKQESDIEALGGEAVGVP